MFGGPGDAEICEACNLEIRANQLAIEGAVQARKQTFSFHTRCFYLWDDERIGARKRRPPSLGAVIVGLLTTHGPLCLECLAEKSGSATAAIVDGIARIRDTFVMTSAEELCAECSRATVIYRLG